MLDYSCTCLGYIQHELMQFDCTYQAYCLASKHHLEHYIWNTKSHCNYLGTKKRENHKQNNVPECMWVQIWEIQSEERAYSFKGFMARGNKWGGGGKDVWCAWNPSCHKWREHWWGIWSSRQMNNPMQSCAVHGLNRAELCDNQLSPCFRRDDAPGIRPHDHTVNAPFILLWSCWAFRGLRRCIQVWVVQSRV